MTGPRIALFGAGYTLERVARLYPKDQTVLLCRSSERIALFQAAGHRAEQIDSADRGSVCDFFRRHPALEILVDSVPPQRHSSAGANATVSSIVEALDQEAHKIRRIIYLSTTGVYGVEDGSWVTERSPLTPQHERSVARVEAENRYRQSSLEICALRIAAIYGPGRGIGLSLQAGRYPLVEGRNRWSNRIHVEDLAVVIASAIDHPAILPAAINVADDAPSPTQEVVNYYCSKFNFPMPMAISLEQARERGLDTLLSNQRVSNRLLHDTFKLDLRYPSFKEGAGSEFSTEQRLKQ